MKLVAIQIVVLFFLGYFVDGFVPLIQSARRPAKKIPTALAFHPYTNGRGDTVSLFMADGEEGKVEEPATKVSKDGTYYDDEVEPTKVTQGISNSMKERLAREASSGLDPDAKQTNVLLYIIGAVAVLVILGGQGIFY